MSVGKRLIRITVGGAVLILVTGLAGGSFVAVPMFILVNLVLAALFILDVRATPKPSCIRLTREMETKLSLAGEHTVTITARNNGDRPLFVEVTDDLPEHFTVVSEPMQPTRIAAHGTAVFRYTVKPVKRGEYLFPAMHFRYPGVYGFCVRQGTVRTDTHYRVYPNMKDLSRYRISALSRNLFMQGMKRVRTQSMGGEFDSLREYATGDPFHAINWGATARHGSLIVNSYVPERNQYINVLLDSSRVMNASYNNVKMLDYGINAAFLLADHCIRGGDNIGLLVFDDQIRRFLKPQKGPAQFSAMAEQLYNVEQTESAADYDTAIRFLARQQRRRSLVFVFTELFNADEAVRFARAVKTHLADHLVYTITIRDPRIEEQARAESTDADSAYLKSAAVKLVQERKAIARVLNAAGIANSDVAPDQLSLAAVAIYLNVKRSGLL